MNQKQKNWAKARKDEILMQSGTEIDELVRAIISLEHLVDQILESK